MEDRLAVGFHSCTALTHQNASSAASQVTGPMRAPTKMAAAVLHAAAPHVEEGDEAEGEAALEEEGVLTNASSVAKQATGPTLVRINKLTAVFNLSLSPLFYPYSNPTDR